MQTHAKQVVQIIQGLPQKDELKFLAKQPANKQQIQETSELLVNTMSNIINFMNGQKHSSQIPYKVIEATVDQLLENTAIQYDLTKKSAVPQINYAQQQQDDDISRRPKDIYGFADCIQLNSDPFVPVLKEKPFALTPLDERILQCQIEGNKQQIEFSHPYQMEIEALTSNNISSTIPTQITKFRDLEPPIYIDTVDKLAEMIMRIQIEVDKADTFEIAVDLEHHHIYSYLGLTSLIQMSTRDQDYIIDPFPIWRDVGQMLNVIFMNPKIIKVLHGADSDVLWLQRDFGLYIVNLFDTFQAAKQLQLQSLSYQFLLQEYCKKYTDKTFQTADWTQRPLSQEMIKYAQMDTHYLLYIYDRMKVDLYNLAIRDDLNATVLIENTFERSKQTSLKVYKKPIQDQDQSLQVLLSKSDRRMDEKSYEIMVKLLEIREDLGIQYDENPRYFLPNGTLFRLVECQPTTIKDLQYQLGGDKRMSEIMKKNLWKFLAVFLEYNQNISATIIPQKSELQQQNIIQQSETIQIEEQKIELKQFDIIVTKYKNQFETVQQNQEQDISQINKIEQQFDCQTPFRLLNCFYEDLGTQIFLSMKQQQEQQQQQKQVQEEQRINNIATDEFMKLPILDQKQQDKNIDIKLTNSLQSNYGVRLKKRHQRTEEIKIKKQSVENRFQM